MRNVYNESVHDLKRIEEGLTNTLRKLRKEIEKLENEKANLFEEIENLKVIGKERVDKLRGEVKTLREEVELFKELAGTSAENILTKQDSPTS
jgi:CHAD domain-containing protein